MRINHHNNFNAAHNSTLKFGRKIVLNEGLSIYNQAMVFVPLDYQTYVPRIFLYSIRLLVPGQ